MTCSEDDDMWGMNLVEPSLVGGPLEALFRLPVSQMSAFEPSALFGRLELDMLRRHRVSSLVDDGWFAPELRSDFRAQRRSAAIVHMALENDLHLVGQTLTSANVEFRVLKGLATGALDYPSSTLRQTGDIDLLVRPDQIEDAEKLLIESGARRLAGDKRSNPSVLKGVTLRSARGAEIDLHTRLTRHSEQDIDSLMARPADMSSGWLAMPTELRLIHAAGHLMWSPFGHRRLSGLIDVGLIRDKNPDLRQVLRLADDLNLAAFVGAGLRVESNIRGRAGNELSHWPAPGALEQRAFLDPKRRVLFEHVLGLRNAPGISGRLSYLREFAVPSPAHLEASGNRRAYFARLFRG